MATTRAGRPLHEIIGKRARARRLERGWRQEDVAANARRYGFDWRRATIGNIENGNHELTLEELLVLCAALGLPAPLLISEGDEMVSLNEKAEMPLEVARLVLFDENAALPEPRRVLLDFPEEHRWPWPDARSQVLQDAARCAQDESVRTIARRVDVHPLALALASFRQWKRCMTDERDRRAFGASPQTRGHVTRALLAELRPVLERKP